MDQNLTLEPTAEETREMETVLRQYLTEMQSLNQQMAHDQQEITRLEQETQALREESWKIGAETRIRLNSLLALDLRNPGRAA